MIERSELPPPFELAHRLILDFDDTGWKKVTDEAIRRNITETELIRLGLARIIRQGKLEGVEPTGHFEYVVYIPDQEEGLVEVRVPLDKDFNPETESAFWDMYNPDT